MIVKTKEFVQSDNDMYFLEIVADKIVINDNYSGVIILNKNLNIIKRLSLIEGITIYSSYVNHINEEILLYCPDNDIIVHINLKGYDYRIIQLEDGLDDLIFSNAYEWHKDYVILSTYNFELVKINMENLSLEKIGSNMAEQLYPSIYKSLELHKKSNIEIENSTHTILNENKIEIFMNGSVEFLYPVNNFIFLKSKFISACEGDFFIVMCSSRADVNNSKLLSYRVYKKL